jgi:hypothetical protein
MIVQDNATQAGNTEPPVCSARSPLIRAYVSSVCGGGARRSSRSASKPTARQTAQHGARGRERTASLWTAAAASGNSWDLTLVRGRGLN